MCDKTVCSFPECGCYKKVDCQTTQQCFGTWQRTYSAEHVEKLNAEIVRLNFLVKELMEDINKPCPDCACG